MNTQLIKLFKAVEVKNHSKKLCPKNLLQKTIGKGFVFAPEVISNYTPKELDELIVLVEKHFGLNAERLNASFHKSWKKVATATNEQLVLEQLIHYITTYGFESLDIYNENSVFIPFEKLEIPALKENINLFVIKGYTKKEIKEKLINFLSSGVALNAETIIDASDLAIAIGVDFDVLEKINNKEVKMAFYNHLDLIPANPTEFLRFVLYKAIGKTLLIKDKQTIQAIKVARDFSSLFNRYEKEVGMEKLSEIFLRFKPLFLAFRAQKNMRPIVNKLRKLAAINHKPMPEDFLNNVTAKLESQESIGKLSSALDNANFFRKARLAHALNFRTKENGSILYRIRNGKGYATEFGFSKQEKAAKALQIVNKSLLKHFSQFNGKTIYIPKSVNYALPTTQKQFVGELPSGTSVTIDKNMIFGVNWNNVDSNRIDLDLSLISIDGKFGLDGSYRGYGGRGNAEILFSGDMTDASGKNGATEAFYISKQHNGMYLVVLNFFNYCDKISVPFKFFAASQNAKEFNRDYLVNPNNVICAANSSIGEKQKIIGLLRVENDKNTLTFIETSIGGSITSRNTNYMNHSRQFIKDYYHNQLGIKDFLKMAGAKIAANPEDCDINLSPASLEKDTFIKMVS